MEICPLLILFRNNKSDRDNKNDMDMVRYSLIHELQALADEAEEVIGMVESESEVKKEDVETVRNLRRRLNRHFLDRDVIM